MQGLRCFSIVLSSGPWHSAHWVLLFLALGLLLLFGIGAIRTSRRQNRRLKSKRALITSITGSIPKQTLDEAKTMPSGTTSKTLAEHWTTCAALWAKIGLLIGRRSEGVGHYREALFCVAVAAGMLYGAQQMSHPQHTTYYGLHVTRILPPDSMSLISPATGPFRADFCPENKVTKYEAKAGYMMCRLTYVDRGCFDIESAKDGFVWVKNSDESTATLSDQDTFKPWPDCHKEELKADAR